MGNLGAPFADQTTADDGDVHAALRAGPQGKARGRYDPRWRVRVNVSDKELWAWRES